MNGEVEEESRRMRFEKISNACVTIIFLYLIIILYVPSSKLVECESEKQFSLGVSDVDVVALLPPDVLA
jgi:hypothetical protein